MARIAEVNVRWTDELRFEGAGAGRPAIPLDGDAKTATSPVELLLLAAGACSAADVVVILKKQRVALESVEVTVRGTRREEHPRRYTAIAIEFAVRGAGADETKVRRAIDLSLEKYCSVVASLAPDIQISYDARIA